LTAQTSVPDLFSNSEVPSLCLRDVRRTIAFRDAIKNSVKAGDVVVDAGSGSGILAMFAAKFGAKKVFACEANHAIANLLRKNIKQNCLENIIEVVSGDIRQLQLPVADLIAAEMIDTWLLDELQIPAINALHESGVIHPSSKILPMSYEAFITFGNYDFDFYGFELPFPVHDWPDLLEINGWLPKFFHPISDKLPAWKVNFAAPIDPYFFSQISFSALESCTINAVKLEGRVEISPGVFLGETVAFNGSKVMPISETTVVENNRVTFDVSGYRGSVDGLGGWQCCLNSNGG